MNMYHRLCAYDVLKTTLPGKTPHCYVTYNAMSPWKVKLKYYIEFQRPPFFKIVGKLGSTSFFEKRALWHTDFLSCWFQHLISCNICKYKNKSIEYNKNHRIVFKPMVLHREHVRQPEKTSNGFSVSCAVQLVLGYNPLCEFVTMNIIIHPYI